MALRVLLADESSTIKKVFQLALQDFGVEVRSVNIGLDVASVATSFKPDIIFADVLLQKKNGYDVCAELKADSKLKTTPVVLMWSGFMELDEDKFQAAKANAQLEKPFDVAALRKLINDLVPRTSGQKLSQYLAFPNAQEEAAKKRTIEETPAKEQASAIALDNDEEFEQVPIPKMKGATAAADKYRLDLKPEELDPQHIPVNYDNPDDQISLDDVMKTDDQPDEFQMREQKTQNTRTSSGRTVVLDEEEVSDIGGPSLDEDTVDLPELDASAVEQMPVAEAHSPGENRTGAPKLQMTAEEIEQIIRAQSKDVIESVVWKVVPELAKQIIERELNKLLKERDSHPY